MEPSTRTTPYNREDQPKPEPRKSDLDVATLAIAACASAVAAFVTSKVWTGGTLFTAAISPVIVALVREGLARPVEKVKTVRLVRTGRVVGEDGSATDERPIPDGAAYEGEALTPVTVYGREESRWAPHRVKIALATGLLAFGIVVAVFTLPELVAGSSVGGGGKHRTTFFGGHSSRKKPAAEDKGARATPTPTASPAPGVTPTATPEATTTAVPTPSATASPVAPVGVAPPAPTTTAAPTTTP